MAIPYMALSNKPQMEMEPIIVEGEFRNNQEPKRIRGASCEGCEHTKVPDQTNINNQSPVIEEKKSNKSQAYLNAAKNLWDIAGFFKDTQEITTYLIGNYVFEWVSMAAARAISGTFLLIKPSVINLDPLIEDPSHVECLKLLEELRNINTQGSQSPTKRASELPYRYRKPDSLSAYIKEQEARTRYFTNKRIGADEAKQKTLEFLKNYEAQPYGELIIEIINTYNVDEIEQNGLTSEKIKWLDKYQSYIDSLNVKRSSVESANNCELIYHVDTCPMFINVPINSPCSCTNIPGIPGVAKYSPISSICEVNGSECQLNGKLPIDTKCTCLIGGRVLYGKVSN